MLSEKSFRLPIQDITIKKKEYEITFRKNKFKQYH